ncbi:hypothetical protein ACQUQP_19885 [Marinobacterium sp. YM272]|uniref:hypothetical protein n=1 Tax=Marinobacterium sp. YM272 TaxID=3421654 RepID=UPI003D7FE7B6
MYLIKDLVDGRIVHYWLDEEENPVSAFFSTIQHAEEWWKAEMFSRYEGTERRSSIIDRRSNEDKRQRLDRSNRFASIHPNGRRVTDEPVKVHRDLVAEKIQQLAVE